MEALKAILTATYRILRTWRVAALLAVVYASLLASLFLFVAIKEARVWQVILTLIFAALAPALFFMLQAMIVNYARGEARARVLLQRSLRDSCKLALASVPLALAAILFLYFLNKLQTYFPAQVVPVQPPRQLWSWQTSQPGVNTERPLQSSLLMFNTIRFLFFGAALPLAAIHLWSATVGDGLLPALKKIGQHLSRAFAPDTVLTYTIGLLLFGLIPYLLLFTHTPASRPAVELGIFVARLLLVFVFTLYGWVLMLDALAGAGGSKRATDTIVEHEVEAEAI